ncbi:MAG: ArsA-related P-loop ATPase [Ilumatobacteraceae bacterium]
MAAARRTSRSRARRSEDAGVEDLLAAKEMVIVCGTGGVGKTTTSAALAALAAVRLGGRVLVLTIDPARRLADAMGLTELSNAAVQVSLDGIETEARGELWAAMLDTKASWDDLVRRHAPDPATRDKILANPLYRNITARFVHSHDYVAMERLHELRSSGDFDLIVVDTPPSRNALTFLDAPARMKDFFGGRLLRWLTVPARSRLFTVASKPFYQIADRVLGSRFLQDIAEFFVLFQTMEAGFVQRAHDVERLLTDPGTTFVVVSTLETAPLVESRHLANELAARGFHLGAVLANRVLPDTLRSRPGAVAAGKLKRGAGALAEELAVARRGSRPHRGRPRRGRGPVRGPRRRRQAGGRAAQRAAGADVGRRRHSVDGIRHSRSAWTVEPRGALVG